jgi:hypothetical protein
VCLSLQVGHGIIPNEHGTWQYGRNGWCDGQNVRPWLADVTKDLRADDEGDNVVEYAGLFEGHDPHAKGSNAGFIMMASSIVFYGASALAHAGAVGDLNAVKDTSVY